MSSFSVAEALKDFILSKPTEWPVTCEVNRIYVEDRKDLSHEVLDVQVMPDAITFRSSSRAGEAVDYDILLLFRCKNPPGVTLGSAELRDRHAELAELTEEIHYSVRRQIYFEDAAVQSDSDLEYFPLHSVQFREFAAMATITLTTTFVEED